MNKLITTLALICLTVGVVGVVASDVYAEWYTLQESANLERFAKTATAKPDHWRIPAHAHLGKLAPYVGVDAIQWTACGLNDDRAVIPCTTYIGIPPRDKLTTARVWQRLNDTAASFDASADADSWCRVMVECDTDSDCESKNGGDGY